MINGRKIFCADVYYSKKQEYEQSNKKYIAYNYDLLLFFHHFQRLIDDRHYEELKSDFKATQSRPSLAHPVEILKHAASFYTLAIFKLFSH